MCGHEKRRHVHRHHRQSALTRRSAALRLLAFATLPPLLLAGCKEKSGPEAIHYDRDTCEMCNMIISDPRFAAEIRDPQGRVHKFDDIGDAVHWLHRQEWFKAGQRPKEFWVKNMKDGRTWLNAYKAFYLSGQVTPMDYGFGAVPEKEPGAVPYEEMEKQVIARGLSSRCTNPGAATPPTQGG